MLVTSAAATSANASHADRFQRFARTTGVCVAVAGAVVLAGRLLDFPLPSRPVPGASMTSTLAVTFVLAGASLWLMAVSRVSWLALLLAGIWGSIALATIGRHLSRGLPPTAELCFVTLAAAVVASTRRSTLWVTHLLATAVALTAAVGCLAYLYNVRELYGLSAYATVAPHTAFLLMLLAAGFLFARPQAGFMAVLVSDGLGGTMARRLLPVAVLAPILIAALRQSGQQLGLYQTDFGVSVFVLSMIVVLSVVILRNARHLIRLESERRAAMEEVRALNEELNARVVERTTQLEMANRELEAFSYSVSHDLRAPLRHIDGFSKILLDEHAAALEPRAQRYLTLIRNGASTMGQMIDDLLQMARVDRREMVLTDTDLNEVVRDTVEDLRDDLGERTIEWQIEPLPVVSCDPGLMKLVFANLLSNAVKYTRNRERAHIRVARYGDEEPPVVLIADNGAGFDQRYADKLFGVFQRLHRTEDFEGTGIGLATVQRIVQKHGGRVWAEAEVDHGATFYFTLGPTPGRTISQSPEPDDIPDART